MGRVTMGTVPNFERGRSVGIHSWRNWNRRMFVGGRPRGCRWSGPLIPAGASPSFITAASRCSTICWRATGCTGPFTEIHNEALGDEAIGYAKGIAPAGSYHAAVVAELGE